MYRDDSSLEAMVKELQRRIRVLETQAPVGFTAVSRGALRILSSEGLIVVGTARTTGTQYVDGRLEGAGVFDWSGAVWLRGSVMVPGNLTGVGSLLWSGPWEMRGNGDITGDVNLTGNITVLPGGKIQVGNIVIDPTISGGAVAFANGAQVFTDGSSIQVYLGNGVMQVSNSSAKIQVGGTRVEVTSGHVYASGMATAPVGDYPGGFIGAVVNDGGEMKTLV